jgi:hypothetical protein
MTVASVAAATPTPIPVSELTVSRLASDELKAVPTPVIRWLTLPSDETVAYTTTEAGGRCCLRSHQCTVIARLCSESAFQPYFMLVF